MRLNLSLSVVFPLFCYLAIGFVCKKTNILDEHTTSKLNTLLFKFLFPLNLFKNIIEARAAFFSGDGGKTIIYLLVFSLFEFILICIISSLITKDKKRKGAFIQGVFSTNTLLFSLVIAQSILEPDELGVMSIAVAIFTPLTNIICITVFEILRGNKPNVLQLLKTILTNPQVIGSAIGFVMVLFRIDVPTLIFTPIKNLSATVTPIALIVLGADLNITSVKHNAKDLTIACILKLIILPAIGIYLGYYLGFRGSDMVSIFSMISVPSAVIGYATAVKLDSDGAFAGEMITLSTLLSIVTVFLWILILPM